MNIRDQDSLIPLTPQVFHILLALAAAQDNGFGIIKTIKEDSQNNVEVATGTLYPALKRLLAYHYVVEIAEHPSSGRHGITKVYRLTAIGRHILAMELKRYEQALQLGKTRLQYPHEQKA